jgi:hypothetical protein
MRTRNLLLMSAVLAAVAAITVPVNAIAKDAERPARLERVEGSDLPRVILQEQAAKRLAIEVSEVKIVGAKRWMLLVGEVEQVNGDALETASISATSTGQSTPVQLRIRVPSDGQAALNSQQDLLAIEPASDAGLAPEDYADAYDPFGNDDGPNDRDDDSDDVKMVMVVPIGPDSSVNRYFARPLEAPPGTLANGQYFEPIKADIAMKLGQQVLVRMEKPDGDENAKIIPYSSVIYDVSGNSWLYTNPEPLVFVRQKISIDRILGNVVVLKEGPEAGTKIVSVGAAELMGVEQKVGN